VDQPDFHLGGRVALVTGASRGIGRDLALALGRAGARVMAASTTIDGCAEVIDKLAANGHEAGAAAMDLRDRESIERAVETTS